jgi:hypothetical protein
MKHVPESPDLEVRLRAALGHRGVNLGLGVSIIRVAARADIESLVRRRPRGIFERRLWFLYEWLTGRTLDVPEATGRLRFVPVLDPARQVALEVGVPSGRHRVIDNLLGTRQFCPMVEWTTALRAASAKQWHVQIRRVIASVCPPERRSVVASRLQRREAECSFVLAGGKMSDPRAIRWADALGQASARTLTLDELLRLQRLVCGGVASAHLRLRPDASGSPSDVERPPGSHAGAQAEDVGDLVGGLIEFANRAISGAVDPVIAAAALAFAFWQIRPFITANGHLHRWLVHYTFDAAGYAPPGVVLPISAAFARRRDEYRSVADSPSGETADAYRFVDMTRAAEFLYSCLEECVERDLRNSAHASERSRRTDGSPKRASAKPAGWTASPGISVR